MQSCMLQSVHNCSSQEHPQILPARCRGDVIRLMTGHRMTKHDAAQHYTITYEFVFTYTQHNNKSRHCTGTGCVSAAATTVASKTTTDNAAATAAATAASSHLFCCTAARRDVPQWPEPACARPHTDAQLRKCGIDTLYVCIVAFKHSHQHASHMQHDLLVLDGAAPRVRAMC